MSLLRPPKFFQALLWWGWGFHILRHTTDTLKEGHSYGIQNETFISALVILGGIAFMIAMVGFAVNLISALLVVTGFEQAGGREAMNDEIWTDYPILELGDTAGQPAPIRRVKPVSYDGDKYVKVIVDDFATEIKAGYLYTTEGEPGSTIYAPVSRSLIEALPSTQPEEGKIEVGRLSDDQELRELRRKYAELRKHWVDFPTPDGGLSIDTDSAADFLRELAESRDADHTAARLRDIADMLDLVAPTVKSLSAKLEDLQSSGE